MDNLERYYPATIEETYAALKTVVKREWGLRSADDFSFAVSFDTGMSAFTSGQRVSANAVPTGNGTTLRAEGSGKVRTQIGNKSALHKTFTQLADAVAKQIQADR